jgi:3alpha(or 20beta)-hydroxysteroid dehydrogenase
LGHERRQARRLDREPEDVARATLFLASDDARFVTGAALMVDNTWAAAS